MSDIWVYVPYAVLVILTMIPTWFLLKRTGMSKAGVLIVLIPPPFGAIIILCVVAFGSWPQYPSPPSA